MVSNHYILFYFSHIIKNGYSLYLLNSFFSKKIEHKQSNLTNNVRGVDKVKMLKRRNLIIDQNNIKFLSNPDLNSQVFLHSTTPEEFRIANSSDVKQQNNYLHINFSIKFV
jgi:hypothetical protein